MGGSARRVEGGEGGLYHHDWRSSAQILIVRLVVSCSKASSGQFRLGRCMESSRMPTQVGFDTTQSVCCSVRDALAALNCSTLSYYSNSSLVHVRWHSSARTCSSNLAQSRGGIRTSHAVPSVVAHRADIECSHARRRRWTADAAWARSTGTIRGPVHAWGAQRWSR